MKLAAEYMLSPLHWQVMPVTGHSQPEQHCGMLPGRLAEVSQSDPE
jgi:hypothetical protein